MRVLKIASLLRPVAPWCFAVATVGSIGAQVLVEAGDAPGSLAVALLAVFLAEVALLVQGARACAEAILPPSAPAFHRRSVGVSAKAALPILIFALLAAFAGAGGHGLFSLLPKTAGQLASLVWDSALGTAFLWASAIACMWGSDPARLSPAVADALEGLRIRAHSPARVARGALSCLLSFVLAFSLLGSDFTAWAGEPSSAAAEAGGEGEGRAPGNGAGANSSADGAPAGVDGGTAGADNAPSPHPEAQAPIDYYEQPDEEGRLVSFDGSAAVYDLGAGSFRTVIGGVATAYLDEEGEAREIDNQLVAAPAPNPVGDASPQLLPSKSQPRPAAQEDLRRAEILSLPNAAADDAPAVSDAAADSPLARAAGAVPQAWEPRANGVRVRIPSQMGEGVGVTYEGEGWSAALMPLAGDFSLARAEGEAVRFTEVLPGVDWQYTMVGSLVKEDVVLNRAVEPFRILEELRLSEGLVPLQRGDGVAVYREEDVQGDSAFEPRAGARAVLELSAPMATDAAGQLDNHLRLALSAAGEGRWTVEVLADWEWLSAPERAYPVRIDPAVNIAPSAMRVTAAEQYAPDTHITETGYAYAGYDDGVKTGTGAFRDGEGLGICRIYVAIQYDFGNIMDEARIDSATLDLHQRWYYSDGKTEFGLYRNLSKWDFDKLTWNTQKTMGHEFIGSRNALKKSGYLSFDVRTPVINWIAGAWPQNGLCVKALDERNMQCEIFDQRDTDYPPRLSIDWTVPDPVPESTSVDATTAKLRPVAEADFSGKLRFDGAFADGVATPRSVVAYELMRGSSVADGGGAYASRSYQYPNSSSWESSLPNGTKYRDKVSNWQSKLFTRLDEDTVYQIRAHAEVGTAVGKYALTDTFLVYRATAKDTLPSIAAHYGTTVDQLGRDNGVQDMLVVGGNTIFVRNPKTTARYAPASLTDTQKRRIDSALMGRNMHCEYGFEPVNLNTGNFTIAATDAQVAGAEGAVLSVERTYNAMAEQSPSAFGPGWASPWDEHLGLEESGAVCWSFGDGRTYWFDPAGADSYACQLLPGAELRRIAYKSGTRTLYRWEARLSDGSAVEFDCNGLLVRKVTPEGLATAFSRDGLGRLTAVAGPFGEKLAVTCDAEGHITQIGLPDGTKLAYGYSAGRLASATDQAGNSARYVYDADGLMTARYDRAGRRVVQNAYDGQGRVVRQTDAEGGVARLEYGDGWTRATDACGNVTTYRWDSYGRTTAIEYADGTSVARSYDGAGNLVADENGTYSYDAGGRMTSKTTKGGRTTRWAYDSAGRVISRTDADGSLTRWERNAKGQVAAEESAAAGRTVYQLDALGRTVAATDADGVRTSFGYSGANLTSVTTAAGTARMAYDAMGRKVSHTDAAGNTACWAWSPTGELAAETDACGATTAYRLDPEGLVLSSTDALGRTTVFSYDECCRMTGVTDAAGGAWGWAYDACGNTVQEAGPEGARVTYGIDARGRVAWKEDALGNRTSYAYDAKGRVTAATDALGNTTTAEWDADFDVAVREADPLGNATLREAGPLGQVLREVRADGSEAHSEWGEGGVLLASVDGCGARTEYGWTAAGRLSSVDREGAAWGFQWDGAGNLAASTDPLGNRTAYTWDGAGNLASAQDPLGMLGRWGYDGCGRQVWQEDGAGNRASAAYDALGNVVSATDALGNAASFEWDALGNLIAQVDALGARTAVERDGLGRPVAATDALGNRTSAAYDALGRTTAVADALGNLTEYEYDALGNLVAVLHPDGAREAWDYDACGNAVVHTDEAGSVTRMAYDAMGRLVAAEDAEGVLLTAAWDGEGRNTESADALGRVWAWQYDRWGNPATLASPGGREQRWQWDAMGNLAGYTDERGGEWSYAHDCRGNMLSQLRQADGALELYQYDAAGNLASYTDALGNSETYEWDGAGNLVAATDPLGAKTAYSWDAAGNLLAQTDPLGNATTYTYDLLGRLTGTETPEGVREAWEWTAAGLPAAHADGRGNRETWEWDARGRLAAETDFSGARTSYAYDALGNLASVTDAAGNAEAYTYTARGHLASRTDRTGATWRFATDAAGRTVEMATPRGLVTALVWDDADNLVSALDNLGRGAGWEYDAAGNLVAAVDALGNRETWEWDVADNIAAYTSALGEREEYAWDAAGNLLEAAGSQGKTTYAWDAAGNLLAQAGPQGARTWAYDAAGRPTASTDALGNRTAWEWNGDGLPVAETSPLGAKTEFAWNASGNLASVTDALGKTSRAEYDPMGRATKVTGRNGNAVSYTWDALGNLASVTDGEGATTAYDRDAEGRLTQVTDALGRTTRYGRDAEGGLTSVEGADGTTETMRLDPAGRVTAMVDGAGNVTEYDWDALDRLVGKSYPGTEHAAVTYAYNGAQEGFSSRIDGLGEARREYDSLGRLVAETDAAGRCIGYVWDDAGRLSVLEYPDGSKVRYSYDDAGNLVGADAPDGTYTYNYDGEGRPTALRRPDGTATEWEYDAAGNVLRADTRTASGTVLASFTYSWDGEGNPVAEESAVLQPDGSTRQRSRAYAYDGAGRLASFEERDGSGALVVRESYGWDPCGNRTAIARTAGERPGQVLFGYDDANRLVSRIGADGSATYAYDKAGRLTSVTEEGQEEKSFSYGAEGRLAAVRQGGRVLLAAVWDGDGNKALQATLYHTDETELLSAEDGQRDASRTSIVGQRFISASASAPTGSGRPGTAAAALGGSTRSAAAATAPNGAATAHEAAAGVAPWPLALLLAPNPAAMERALAALLFGGGSATDQGGPWNNAPAAPGSLDALLPQAGLTPAEAARVSGEALLAGDVAARRAMATGPTANAPPSGAPVPVEGPYVQERWELAEYATASALSDLPQTLWRSSSATGASENLVYGEGAALLSALPSAAGGASPAGATASSADAFLGLADGAMTGTALPAASGGAAYIADGLGSVASVLSGGSVSAAYSYSPWGEASGAGELPFAGYNSEEHSGGGTGLQYLRARFYDAASAAFPAADSWLGDPSDPASLNRYAYCGGNPVAFSDPSGNVRHNKASERTDWLRNNSAKAKQRKQNVSALLARLKAPPGIGVTNLKKSLQTVPLYNKRASRLVAPAPYASQKWRTEVQGRVSPIFQDPSSPLPYASGGSSGTRWSWSTAKPRGLFPHVVPYGQAQSQQIRERFCSRSMKRMGDQVPEPVKNVVQVIHVGLDAAGFVPVLGAGPDALNSLIYFAEGNTIEGLVSAGATIPFAGDFGNGAYKLAKHGDDIADAAAGAAKAVSGVAKGADAAAGSASAVERAVRAANKVGEYKPGEKPDSSKLGKALEKFGDVRPDYSHAAHHIVPGGHSRAKQARDILDEYRIGINSAANGAFLPSEKGITDAAYHGSLNRFDYIDMVNDRIKAASERGATFEETRTEILLELSKIKDELQSPGNPWIKEN